MSLAQSRLGTIAALAASILLVLLALALSLPSLIHAEGKIKGMRPSDPQYTGPRDMNYDHTIVPGDRVGPAIIGASVRDVLKHLGNPDVVNRQFYFKGSGLPDVVYYWYTKGECIYFAWNDSGIDPKIAFAGTDCSQWSLPGGIHVGSSMVDVNSFVGEYCPVTFKDGRFEVFTKTGIAFTAKNRNSPVTRIDVNTAHSGSWNGMCKD